MRGKLKTISVLIILAVLVNLFVPAMKVFAFADTNSVTISFRNSYNSEQGKVQYSVDDGATWIDVTTNIENRAIVMNGDNLKIKIVPNSNYNIDWTGITYKEDNGEELELNSNQNSSIAGGLMSNNGYQVNSNVKSVILNNVEFRNEEHHDEGQPGEGPRYGWDNDSVYFVWATNGEANNFYYHKITGIIGGGTMNYIPVSQIIDENNNTIKYNIGNRSRYGTHADGFSEEVQSYEFVWTNALDEVKNDEEFLTLPTTQKFDFLFENEMTVNPIRALNGANCISTMGDLAFKLTIYNDVANTYEGIKVGVPTNYEYFPSFWDGDFHWDIVDVSGSTQNNPMVYEAFLLEKTLQLNSAGFSRSIASIKAIGVPDKAVTINNAGDGKWNITYNSNYYDDVELELTDVNGQKYYIILLRVNVKLRQYMNDETRTNYAEIYYPSTDSYTKYSIVLTIKYKNGQTETRVIKNPVKGIEATNGDFQDVYEFTGGENLKVAWYKLDGITNGPNSSVESFYINVVKDYSGTSENFGGTLAGANDGIEFRDEGRGFERVVIGGVNNER